MPETLETIGEKLAELSAQVDARFAQVDARFERVDARFAQIDARFERVDARFAQIDARFDEVTGALVEQRKYTEFAFDRLREEVMGELGQLKIGVGTLDRKLDRVLDTLARSRRPPRCRS